MEGTYNGIPPYAIRVHASDSRNPNLHRDNVPPITKGKVTAMTTIRFYVGEGFKAVEFARRSLLPMFGGATITESHGFWTAPDGQIFDEPGHIITLVVDGDDDIDRAVKAARWQAGVTGEQSVMVELGDGITWFTDAL